MDALREGIRLAELNGERFWLSRFPNTLGWIRREAQDFEAALRLDSENVSLAREMEIPEAEANSLVNLGHDYLSLGEADRAFGHFQEAAAIYEQDVWFRWRYETRLQAELARYWIFSRVSRTSHSPRHGMLEDRGSDAVTQVHRLGAQGAWRHRLAGRSCRGCQARVWNRPEDCRCPSLPDHSLAHPCSPGRSRPKAQGYSSSRRIPAARPQSDRRAGGFYSRGAVASEILDVKSDK